MSGLSKRVIFTHIVLPIALRTSVRPLGSVLINMILTSSILSTITLNELTGQAKIVASDTFRPFEVYAVLLIVYAALTWLVSIGIGMLHRRLNRDMQPDGALMRYADFTPYDLVLLLQGLGVTIGAVPRDLADRHACRHCSGRSCASTACPC